MGSAQVSRILSWHCDRIRVLPSHHKHQQDSEVFVVVCVPSVLLSTSANIGSDYVLTSWYNSGSAQISRTLFSPCDWIRVLPSYHINHMVIFIISIIRSHWLQDSCVFVVFCVNSVLLSTGSSFESDFVQTWCLDSGSAEVGRTQSWHRDWIRVQPR